jgi:hypothetical protein
VIQKKDNRLLLKHAWEPYGVQMVCQEAACCTASMQEARLLRQHLTLAPLALATLTVLSELPPSTTRTSDTPLCRTLQEQRHSCAQVNQWNVL